MPASVRRPGLGPPLVLPLVLLLPLLLLLLAAGPGRAQQEAEGAGGTCPTVPVQRAPEVTAALLQCEAGDLELRLGFHSTAEAGFDSGALQGVAVAVRAINDGGLLAGWGAPANATVRPFYKAVGYDKPYAIEAALELTQEARVNAVIGGGSSSRSILAQYVFGLAGIPQVSQTSTAPTLSDKATYPTFSRVVPPDEWQGSSLAGIVRDLGWRSISVLYTTDDYARELMKIFTESAERDGIRIRSMASFAMTDNPDEDLSAQMQTLKRSKTNIFALIVGNTESAFAALQAADEAGLAGPPYVWMGVDGWFSRELTTLANPAVKAASNGALGLVPFVSRSGPGWDKFLREWQSTPLLPQSAVGPRSPVDVAEACTPACLETPPWGGAKAYDATMLVAKAWARTIRDGGDPRDLTSGDLLRAIRSVTLDNGVTGVEKLDAEGNPLTRKYDVFQLQQTAAVPWAAVGTIDDVAGLELVGGGTLQDDSLLDFGLGPGVVPGDGSQPVAREAVQILWVPDDFDKHFGNGNWFFGAKNVYDEWVPVTPAICSAFEVEVFELSSSSSKPPAGQELFQTACEVPEPADLAKFETYLDFIFPELSLNNATETTVFNQLLALEGDSSVSDPDQLLSALCVCPLQTETFTDDPTLMPDVSFFVTYEKEPLPGYHPISIYPNAPPPPSQVMNLLKIILPTVFAVLLLCVAALLIFVHRMRRAQMTGWMIKDEELEFDDPVKLLGQGGQGDVVAARFRGTEVAVKRTLLPGAGGSGSRKSTGKSAGKSPRTGTGTVDDIDKPLGIMKGSGSPAGGDIEAPPASSAQSSGRYSDLSRASSASLTSTVSSTGGGGGLLGWLSCGLIGGGGDTFAAGLESADSSGRSSLASSLGSTTLAARSRMRSMYSSLFREMRLVTKLRHPNVVQTMGAVVAKGQPPQLVMELMSNGSLYSIIHNDVLPLDIELVAGILSDAAKGLRYLHEAKPPVIHGDLKAMNILVDDRLTGKLADFGLSFLQGKANIEGGSLLWMAPELLTGAEGASEASDVYALGVTMYEMFFGLEPYEDVREADMATEDFIAAVAEKDLRPAIPPRTEKGTMGRLELEVPAEFVDLMAECWHKNPLRRPSIKEIEERVLEVIEAKGLARTSHAMGKQQEKLLQDILPPKVIKALAEGRKVEPEPYDPVTIFFSDIVGFTTISQTMPPEKVMAMLDDMYSRFDALVRRHGLFKVETIGDAYMCVGGIPEPQADHTLRVARFAIEAINSAAEVPIDAEDPGRGCVKIRVGFHSGSVVASVVGSVNPRYCLFGDTVNVASRMESNSLERRINMSPQAHAYLMEQSPEAACEDRGRMEIKGKGKMNCWFLTGIGELVVEAERPASKRGSGKF